MELTKLAEAAEQGQEGVWVEFEDSRFKIRSTTSKAYRKAIQKAAKGKSNHKLTKDLEAAEDFGIEAMADGLLLDWENITDNGVQLECNRANRIRVLKIAAPIRDFLAQAAQDYTTFEREDEEEDSATFRGDGGMASEVGEAAGTADRQGGKRGRSGSPKGPA